MNLLVLVTVVSCMAGTVSGDQTDIRMPSVLPQKEAYICVSVPVGEEELYITGFKALTETHNAHHILLFGCEEPGSQEQTWDCGEMSTGSAEQLEKAPTCASSPNILYAWAKEAPPLVLPKDVAFRVGGESRIQHIVMQVHYMHDSDKEDNSGVAITYTDVPQPKTAATMLLVTGGAMAPQSTETFETACVIDEDVVLHPFAYRTHTHRHGKDVGGWIVQENEKGEDQWSLIGRRDPQLPQMFVPVQNTSLTISQGDMLAAKCVIKNDEDRVLEMGNTGEDEMCNFYVMYWAEEGQVLKDNICFSPGAPNYYWSSEAHLNHIPK